MESVCWKEENPQPGHSSNCMIYGSVRYSIEYSSTPIPAKKNMSPKSVSLVYAFQREKIKDDFLKR